MYFIADLPTTSCFPYGPQSFPVPLISTPVQNYHPQKVEIFQFFLIILVINRYLCRPKFWNRHG